MEQFFKSIWKRNSDALTRKRLERKHKSRQGILSNTITTNNSYGSIETPFNMLIPVEIVDGRGILVSEESIDYHFDHGFVDIGVEPYGTWCSSTLKAKIADMNATPLEIDVNRYPADESPFERDINIFDWDLQPPAARSGHAISWVQGLYSRIPINYNTFTITDYSVSQTNSGLLRIYYSGSTASDYDRPYQLGVLQIGAEANLKWVIIRIRDDGEVAVWRTEFLPGGNLYRDSIMNNWATMDSLERNIRKTELMGLLVPRGLASIVRPGGGIAGSLKGHTWAYSREDCTQGAHAAMWTREDFDPIPESAPYNTLRVYEMTLVLNDVNNMASPSSWNITLSERYSGDWLGYGDAGDYTSAQVCYASRLTNIDRELGGGLNIEHGGEAKIACWYDLSNNLVTVPITGTENNITPIAAYDTDPDICALDSVHEFRVESETQIYDFTVGDFGGDYKTLGSDITTITHSIARDSTIPTTGWWPTTQTSGFFPSGDDRWCSGAEDVEIEHGYLRGAARKILRKREEKSGLEYVKDGAAVIVSQKIREGVWLVERGFEYSSGASDRTYETREEYGLSTRRELGAGVPIAVVGSGVAIYKTDIAAARRAAAFVSSNDVEYNNRTETAKFYGNVSVNIVDESASIGEDLDLGWQDYCYRQYTLGILIPTISPIGRISASGEYAFGTTGDAADPELMTSTGWPTDPGDGTLRNVIPIGGV